MSLKFKIVKLHDASYSIMEQFALLETVYGNGWNFPINTGHFDLTAIFNSIQSVYGAFPELGSWVLQVAFSFYTYSPYYTRLSMLEKFYSAITEAELNELQREHLHKTYCETKAHFFSRQEEVKT